MRRMVLAVMLGAMLVGCASVQGTDVPILEATEIPDQPSPTESDPTTPPTEPPAALEPAVIAQSTEPTTATACLNHFYPRFIWSPDGKRLAIGGEESILMQDLETNIGYQFTPQVSPVEPLAWSPDGQWLIVDSADGVSVISVDGTHETPVFAEVLSNWNQLSWSPDSATIAYSAWGTLPQSILSVIAPENIIAPRRQPSESLYLGESIENVAWSPDGNYIAFTDRTYRDGDDLYDLKVISPEGRNLIHLTDDFGASPAPIWSPDSQQLVFRDVAGYPTIINVDGTGQRRLAEQVIFNQDYQWLPSRTGAMTISSMPYRWRHDGRGIVFLSYDEDMAKQIYEVRLDGTLNLLYELGEYEFAMISPDASQIAVFYQFEDKHYELYVMNVDGSQRVNQARSFFDILCFEPATP